jgi:hypothetical protein
MKWIKMLLLYLCSLIIAFQANAQRTVSREYQVKAVFLYNFSQFVVWPPSSFEGPSAPFIIGILGPDIFGNYLDETIANENIMGHPMIVKRYSDADEIRNCHILFITSEKITKALVTASNNHGILTVGDDANFTKNGGMIRFFTENNKIRLEINPSAVKAANLEISSKLLRVARILE